MANSDAKVAPFLRGEDQLKQDWLCLLMADDHAPLDVCYKANLLKIEREFYPFAVYDFVCEANWDATSYWEHTETYQEPREETVYIDYKGNEHKRSGKDTEYRNGRSIDHYRKPMSRTVYDTKKKTVVDNIEQTSGRIGPTRIRKIIWTGPAENQSAMVPWIGHLDESQLRPIGTNGLPGIEMPEAVSSTQAQGAARDQAADTVVSMARQQVPGDRFENLGISGFNVVSESRTDCYLSAYHVYYEYEGKQYDCILTGGNNTSDVVIKDRPIDTEIQTHAESIDASIKENNGCVFLLITIVFGLGGLLWLLMGIMGRGPLDLIGGLACIGGAVFCGLKYKTMNEQKKIFKAQKERFTADNTDLKQRIFDLIQDDSIPEEQKGPMIEKWVNEYKASIGA